jgi:hypothetical protein
MATLGTITGMQQPRCPHCEATGTCKQGPNAMSCATCLTQLARSRLQRWLKVTPQNIDLTSPKTCLCCVCYGRGFVEGATFKLRNYFPFFFAMVFVVSCFLLFWFQPMATDKLESSLVTILGTIVGFYFGGRRNDG